MDRKTLGGKKKLVFAPRVPDAFERPEDPEQVEKKINSAAAPETREQDRTKKKREKEEERGVELVGGREEHSAARAPRNSKEIFSEDLLKLENAPRVVQSLANRGAYTETFSSSALERGKKYLLQIPKLVPEEGARTIRGRLRIKENGEATLTVSARINEDEEPKEIVFLLGVSEVKMQQDVFKREKAGISYRSIGNIESKLVSRIHDTACL